MEHINKYNRYINGKGLEISNSKNFIASISEIIIYSGLNRPFDIAYLNPISSHLEIEHNKRQNLTNLENANAIWQISFDNLLNEKLRFSNNFIIDEFILDSEQRDSGKVNSLGWSSRLSYSFKRNDNLINLYGSAIFIGTNTMRHGIGYNNFVQRGNPLGWSYGSDGYELKVGIRSLIKNKLMIRLDFGKYSYGNQNVKERPYEPYIEIDNLKLSYVDNTSNSFLLESFWNYKENSKIILKYSNNYAESHGKQLFSITYLYQIF